MSSTLMSRVVLGCSMTQGSWQTCKRPIWSLSTIFCEPSFQSTNLLVQSFFFKLKKKLLTTNGNMSSRIFGEIFCNLTKEGKKGRSVTKVLCMVKARGHWLHHNPIMPMALSFTYHIKLFF